MAKVFLLMSLFLVVCSVPAIAQFDIPEINKLKEIKMLESNVFDIQRLLFDYKSDGWDADEYEQIFMTENYSIEIYFSSGNCSEDDEIWNAPEWKVRRIEIEPDDPLKIKDLGFDLQTLKKEQTYGDSKNLFVYHDKEKGVAFHVDEKDSTVGEIILFAGKSSKAKPCNNKKVKEFLNYESWFGSSKLKDRHSIIAEYSANVTNLELSESEIPFLPREKKIQVSTTAVDPENDVLTYHYTVSAGKIIGSGPKVIWDLSGLMMGTYSITAGVDDGCGICGNTMTKTVTIR
jgi:hypothetical protein